MKTIFTAILSLVYITGFHNVFFPYWRKSVTCARNSFFGFPRIGSFIYTHQT